MSPLAHNIKTRILADRPLETVPPPVIKQKGIATALLGGSILVLSSLIVLMLLFKAHPKEVEVPFDPGIHYEERISKLEHDLAVWGHRVWLLGVAHNENANIAGKLWYSQHRSNPGYITFDNEWKLNRLPSLMKMPDYQRKLLSEDIK